MPGTNIKYAATLSHTLVISQSAILYPAMPANTFMRLARRGRKNNLLTKGEVNSRYRGLPMPMLNVLIAHARWTWIYPSVNSITVVSALGMYLALSNANVSHKTRDEKYCAVYQESNIHYKPTWKLGRSDRTSFFWKVVNLTNSTIEHNIYKSGNTRR